MKIIIDGDGCPVKQEIIDIAIQFDLEIYLITSYAHYSHNYNHHLLTTIYVDNQREMADYKIIEHVRKGDIVITQDYGLASLCLNKAIVLHHSGHRYSHDNIEQLLYTRHLHQQIRKQGGRHKGAKPFTQQDHQYFKNKFHEIIGNLLNT